MQIFMLTVREPFCVTPVIIVYITDNGGGHWPHFGIETVWVAFKKDQAVHGLYLILIRFSFRQPWYKQLPDPRSAKNPHRMSSTVPSVKISHDTDADGVRRPYRKIYAVDIIMCLDMRPHLSVHEVVITFCKQMEVITAHYWEERVGVMEFLCIT